MALIEHFATRTVEAGDRLDFWNRIVGETFAGLGVDSRSDEFNAEMWRWSVGDLTLIRPRSRAAVVQRWADNTASALDRVILHFQHRGRSTNRQWGREAELQSGDFTMCLAQNRYRVDLCDQNAMLVVEMPRAALAQRLPDFEDAIARRIPGTGTGARLLHDFMLSLWQQGDQSAADPEWQAGVANVFLDLVALAVRGSAAPQALCGRRIEERLRAIVEAQLSDPDLRTSTLADALNVSMRSVQHAFAAMGTTPSGYILERRLDRAADRLAAEHQASITTVAFDLGFNDSAYFTRCFRQRFGTTPSAWRAQH